MPSRDTAVFYVSGHGFGHAMRQIEIINALTAVRPNLRLVVRTSAPRHLFDRSLTRPFLFGQGEADTGVVQIDSLHVDAAASIGRAWDFHRTLEARANSEGRFLESHNATLVAGDIPTPRVRRGSQQRRASRRHRQLHLGLDLRALPRAGGHHTGPATRDPERLCDG